MTFLKSQLDNEDNLIDQTINGNCSRCGKCCGMFIPFTRSELKTIRQYVKKHKIKPIDRMDKETNTYKAHCCFLDEENHKCLIYEVRPFTCRNFICNREDWKKYRDLYSQKGYYNCSSKNKPTILASFDDLIYNDIKPLLTYITGLAKDENNNISTELFISLLKHFNRTDILEHMIITTDDNKKLEGKQFLNS